MINTQNFYDYNYDDIERFSDPYMKNYLLAEYIKEMKSIFFNFPNSIDYNLSIIKAIQIVELLEESLYSNYMFPGEYIKCYPSTKEVIAKKNYICLYSGARININDTHLKHKILLKNQRNKDFYVSQDIRTEIITDFSLPLTMSELDLLQYQLNNAYDLDLENLYDFSTLNKGEIRFRKLNK